MSQFQGLLGWTPPHGTDWVHVDCPDFHSELDHSFSSLSTSSSPSETTGGRTGPPQGSDSVPRPRNAFIIFRCEWVQLYLYQRRMQDPKTPRPLRTIPLSGISKEPSLSMRASIAWRQMSPEEKEPYEALAKKERDDHATKYPGYRFCPRTRTSKRKKRNNKGSKRLYPAISDDIAPAPEHTVSSSPILLGWSPDSNLAGNAPDAGYSTTDITAQV